jgi:putative FmdB family regulatory protein
MPTYAYACTACEHSFEVQQSFSDSSLTVCPECDGRLRKVFASVGVVFKGPGFYRNDSRAGAIRPSHKTSANRGSESTGSSGTSTAAPASTPAATSGPSTSSATSSSGASRSAAAS